MHFIKDFLNNSFQICDELEKEIDEHFSQNVNTFVCDSQNKQNLSMNDFIAYEEVNRPYQ